MYSLPGHYRSNSSGIEVIEIARHMGFSLGNVAKFIGRAGEEAGFVADLEKALFYIDDALDNADGVPTVDVSDGRPIDGRDAISIVESIVDVEQRLLQSATNPASSPARPMNFATLPRLNPMCLAISMTSMPEEFDR